MSKKSKITNLLVIPLIASTVFLASPALADNPNYGSTTEVRHKTDVSHIKKGVVGTVTSVNGTIIVVTAQDNTQYTVDASHATIMKASTTKTSTAIATISDIKVGDRVMVRGTIDNTEIDAKNIFDGKIPFKHLKNPSGKKIHLFNK